MRSALVSVAATVAVVLLAATTARGGGSSPVLSLTAAETVRAPSGAVVVAVDGSFNFGDLVEGVFPGALVVWSGARFVRYAPDGAALTGTAPSLADGLDPIDVPGLMGLGTAAAAPVALIELHPDRIAVVLPGDFPRGAASVALVAVHEGEPFTSNTLGVSVP